MVKKLEALLDAGGVKKDVILLVISAIALILSLTKALPLPFDIAWAAIILCGVPIVLEAIIGLVTSFDIKADVLVSMALIASVCIGETFAAGEVAFIMQLGALLEDITVARAQAGIEKLVRLTPRTARVINDGTEKVIAADEVKKGDILRVLPGETVPVDGTVISGETTVDQSVMTGESMPVDKAVGDSVSSGTVNLFGTFEMRGEKVGEDSSIQRMIRLVQSADAKKAKIVGIADRWATWIVVIALTAAIITWIITGEIIRGVTILVVFCPCALVLATPTAIMAAIGNASKHGFLVREGDALERLADVAKVTFDKTGTLTLGTPQVIKTVSVSDKISSDELYALCAAAEQYSEHPLGKAIVRCYKRTLLPADNFSMIPGQGVKAYVNGKAVIAGNEKLFCAENCPIKAKGEEYLNKGCTVTYVGVDGCFAGFVALADTLRKSSRETVNNLISLGITPVLLTGDNGHSASEIAKSTGISEYKAECLPEDKLEYIETSQKKGEKICMVGDGINDAPALKQANAGIAMGGIGSDIAAQAADIVLINDEINQLPHLFALSKKMMRTVKLNMIFSMALNFLAIILAITGVLGPVTGALVHNAGSVLVISNSALLLKWRWKKQ